MFIVSYLSRCIYVYCWLLGDMYLFVLLVIGCTICMFIVGYMLLVIYIYFGVCIASYLCLSLVMRCE